MNRRTQNHSSVGFSLIEVLIAVLVLGIGLLGIASVFPVVISQQRDATDVIRGGVASAAIRDEIRSNPDIAAELLSQDGYADADEPDLDGDRVPNDTDDMNPDPAASGPGEPIFGQHRNFNAGNFNPNEERFNPVTGYSYLWEADWNWGAPNNNLLAGPRSISIGANLLDQYRMDGGVRFRDPQEKFGAVGVADLPVQGRLYPRPYSVEDASRDGPLFVWDFVPRRTPRGGVQVVVFVRRIDTGIRVDGNETLSQVLISATNRVFPVGVDAGTRRPTLNGTGEYAVPISAAASAVPSADYPFRPEGRVVPPVPVLRDGVRLTIDSDQEVCTAVAADLPLVAEVGQRFVDNLGVVRTVVEVLGVNAGQVDLRVTPELPLAALVPAFGDGSQNTVGLREAARVGKLRQVVFTAHEPVDVFTMEFSR